MGVLPLRGTDCVVFSFCDTAVTDGPCPRGMSSQPVPRGDSLTLPALPNLLTWNISVRETSPHRPTGELVCAAHAWKVSQRSILPFTHSSRGYSCSGQVAVLAVCRLQGARGGGDSNPGGNPSHGESLGSQPTLSPKPQEIPSKGPRSRQRQRYP